MRVFEWTLIKPPLSNLSYLFEIGIFEKSFMAPNEERYFKIDNGVPYTKYGIRILLIGSCVDICPFIGLIDCFKLNSHGLNMLLEQLKISPAITSGPKNKIWSKLKIYKWKYFN